MRRLIAAVLMVGLTGFGFAGCGGSDDDDGGLNGGGNGGGGGGGKCETACTKFVDLCLPSGVGSQQKQTAIDQCASDCNEDGGAGQSTFDCVSNASTCSEVRSCDPSGGGGGGVGGGDGNCQAACENQRDVCNNSGGGSSCSDICEAADLAGTDPYDGNANCVANADSCQAVSDCQS